MTPEQRQGSDEITAPKQKRAKRPWRVRVTFPASGRTHVSSFVTGPQASHYADGYRDAGWEAEVWDTRRTPFLRGGKEQ